MELIDGIFTNVKEKEMWRAKWFLQTTDWVVIKTLELQLSGKKATHDYSDIFAEREKARSKINELEVNNGRVQK